MKPLTIDFSAVSFTDDHLYHLCCQNEVLHFEMTAQAEMLIMSPIGGQMQEYIDNGAQLGWLLDPQNQQVEIYEPGKSPLTVPLPTTLSGGNVLPGFQLTLPLF